MKMILKYYFLTSLVICASTPVRSQDDIVSERLLENVHRWSEGSILLREGTEIKGLLRFDDNTGLLNYQNGDVSNTYIARTVAGFEFFDEESNGQRIFYSLDYDDGNSFKKAYFFEVLKEFKEFAVLSKVDPIEVKQRANSAGGGFDAHGRPAAPNIVSITTIVSQTETIYIMDINGMIKPYVQILEKESDNLFSRKRTKNKFIDKQLLEGYTKSYHERLEVFADENDLTFRRKSDLVQILNYYQELITQ